MEPALPMRNSVFVVDDDPSMRTCIMRLLRVHGFKSKLFDSADALLRHDDFGEVLCVILDIDLSGESGIAVCRCLANKGLRLPVILSLARTAKRPAPPQPSSVASPT